MDKLWSIGWNVSKGAAFLMMWIGIITVAFLICVAIVNFFTDDTDEPPPDYSNCVSVVKRSGYLSHYICPPESNPEYYLEND